MGAASERTWSLRGLLRSAVRVIIAHVDVYFWSWRGWNAATEGRFQSTVFCKVHRRFFTHHPKSGQSSLLSKQRSLRWQKTGYFVRKYSEHPLYTCGSRAKRLERNLVNLTLAYCGQSIRGAVCFLSLRAPFACLISSRVGLDHADFWGCAGLLLNQ